MEEREEKWPESPSLPYLVYWSLRRDQLCIPQGCDNQIEVRDEQDFLVRRERCAECPLDKLDLAVAACPSLPRAYDLDFALTAGFSITLDEVNVEEFKALKVLRVERDKYQAEQIKRQQNNSR